MTKKYWVVGHPLTFCLTTEILNAAFKEVGIDAEFETKDISPEQFPDVLAKLKSGELSGIIPTRPFKTPSLEFLDEKSEMTRIVNAANLIIAENGKLHGFNTDGMGATRALQSAMPDLSEKKVLILGAGGAARAAAYICKKEGAQVSIWNRTPERARLAAESLGLNFVEDMREWEEKPDIIINATSLSDQDKQSTLVPFTLWENVQVAMDAVYGKTSLFLEEAKAVNVPNVLPGNLWFLKQTIRIFEKLTDKEPPIQLMTRLTNEAHDIMIRGR